MRHLLLLLVVFVTACSSTQKSRPVFVINPVSKTDHKEYDIRYDELVEVVKDAATQDEFIEIREVYVNTSHYKPYLSPEQPLTKGMFKALGSSDWETCLQQAEDIFDFNYISLSAHYGAMVCNNELGNEDQARYHKYVMTNLIDAIWATGDGETIETAFFCTSTTELYAFIQLHGLQPTKQSLVHQEGKAYDYMSVENAEEGTEYQWYFDISSQWVQGIKGF